MLLLPFQPAHECIGKPVNRFYFGDMREMGARQPELAGAVQLAYLDPPFATGKQFTHKIRYHNTALDLEGYDDSASAEMREGLHMTLAAIHKMLSPEGAVVVHVDHRLTAYVRMMLDEIFSPGNFVNEIIWAYASGGRATRFFSRKHDTLWVYRKSRKMFFDIRDVGKPRGAERRNHMKRTVEDGRVSYSIRSGGKVYSYGEDSLVYPSDVWTDIAHLQQRDPERTGYATQKPEALLERILLSMSRAGDMVLDPCCGSGTTAVVARRLGRRFVAADNAPIAAHTLRRRLLRGEPDTVFIGVPCDELNIGVETRFLNGGVYARPLSPYAQSKTAPAAEIAYWALGSMEGDSFIVADTAQSRSKPEEILTPIEARINGRPALHVVTVDGRQAFWEVVG